MQTLRFGTIAAIIAGVFSFTTVAAASDVLFVSDNGADNGIATALMAAGHSVTVVNNDYAGGTNPTLNASLSAYDVVFWTANGAGAGGTHLAATMTALTSYVSGGGYVFVTGYDAIASPLDSPLVSFLGGTGSQDVPPAPGPVANIANALTTGVVDVRETTPTGGFGDRDALTGLAADTVGVVFSSGSTTQAHWTLRSVGSGKIAYVSNGATGSSDHASWTTAGNAYHNAILNFAEWADGARVLLVSDSGADLAIGTALSADGHVVTVRSNNYAAGANPGLVGDLTAFDVVFWSASGDGLGGTHDASTFTSLTDYLASGGRVLVTGYDTLVSPPDPNLVAFLGGAGATDVPPAPGPVSAEASELSTGAVDILGLTPSGGSNDRDALTGLSGTTLAVVGNAAQAQWSVRSAGAGRAAYVSNGNSGASSHASWTTTAPGGSGGAHAYNAAIRNFAFWAEARVPAGEVTGAPNGEMCAVDADCASAFCVDGVCCDSACGASAANDCQACTAALTGGTDGTCAAVSAGTECRASGGLCDPADSCDGTRLVCPSNVLAVAGTECRGESGLCDVAEVCTGSTAGCPADSVAPAGVVCRSMMGACDVAEMCDGADTACPENAFLPAGVICRPGTMCDLAEGCSGLSASCPADMLAPNGAACDDGRVCNEGEVCMGGACGAGTATDCDDGNVCTADMCSEAAGCAHVAVEGCCRTADMCDDDDLCTADSCGGDHTCVNMPIAGCGEDAGVADAGVGDAGVDGGSADAGGRDAGMQGSDAGMSDGGTISDGGISSDAGEQDGSTDAQSDAATDVGPPLPPGDPTDCNCSVPGGRGPDRGLWFAGVFVVGLAMRRRRR